MKERPLFDICAEYLELSNADIAAAMSHYAKRSISEGKISAMRAGRKKVPLLVWSTLRKINRTNSQMAQELISWHKRTGRRWFYVTEADMNNPNMSETLIVAILSLPSDMGFGYDPVAARHVKTWYWNEPLSVFGAAITGATMTDDSRPIKGHN